jgi:hypothetical protein
MGLLNGVATYAEKVSITGAPVVQPRKSQPCEGGGGHELAPLPPHVPLAHTAHSVDTTDPVVERYVPAEQRLQLVAPLAAWYCPAAQLAQTPSPPAEYFPEGQEEHVVDATAPALAEKSPAAQFRQPAPAAFAYVPVAQRSRVSKSNAASLAVTA